jgi:hypothetical protein
LLQRSVSLQVEDTLLSVNNGLIRYGFVIKAENRTALDRSAPIDLKQVSRGNHGPVCLAEEKEAMHNALRKSYWHDARDHSSASDKNDSENKKNDWPYLQFSTRFAGGTLLL